MKHAYLFAIALALCGATAPVLRADGPTAEAPAPAATAPAADAPKLESKEVRDKDGNVIARYTAYEDPKHAAQNGGRSEVKQGQYTQYYPSGQVKRTVTYEQDVPNGPEKWYFPNGKLWQSFTTKNGKIVGNFQTYSPAGVLVKTDTYDDNGQLTRTSTGP